MTTLALQSCEWRLRSGFLLIGAWLLGLEPIS
jgi:hypothetical protein